MSPAVSVLSLATSKESSKMEHSNDELLYLFLFIQFIGQLVQFSLTPYKPKCSHSSSDDDSNTDTHTHTVSITG